MDSLAVLAVSLPLSTLVVYQSYLSLIVNIPRPSLSSHAAILVIAALAIHLNSTLFSRYTFSRRARALGCATPPSYPHKDPILGLDTFFAALAALKSKRLLYFQRARFRSIAHTHYTLALGNPILMTDEPENIKAILSSKFDDFAIAGPRLLATLPVLGPNSIFTSNGPAWHAARASLRPAFVRDQVADIQRFDRHVGNFVTAVLDKSGRAEKGKVFDVQALLMQMTMDSSTDFLMGYSTDLLVRASPEAARFLKDFEFASERSATRARLGTILTYIPDRELTAAVTRLREYVRTYLRKASEEGEKGGQERKYVFLDELLKGNPPEDYTIDQILSVIVAGRDTTAVAMSACFYFLARHPEVVKKLRAEIKELAEQLGEKRPTWEQLRDLPYLRDVIREALRLFTPISFNSREAVRETVLPRGGGPNGKQPVLVPKGTSVRWSSDSMHRREDIFGPDSDQFRPERWQEGLRVSWEYMPFSGGPRVCLGQQFALTQICYLLYRFFSVFQTIEPGETGPLLTHSSLTGSFPYGCLISVARGEVGTKGRNWGEWVGHT